MFGDGPCNDWMNIGIQSITPEILSEAIVVMRFKVILRSGHIFGDNFH